jgi:hypothetical protein
MTESGSAPVTRSWRTHCRACGSRKAKVWGPNRSTLSKHCPNEACTVYGVPQLFAVQTVVTIDRLGRRHVSHRELTVRRRPQFEAPDGPRPLPTEGA